MNKTYPTLRVDYPYTEFTEHLKAMKYVRNWEDTSRFGHLGNAQDNRSKRARIIDYFLDCYADSAEALRKAEMFLLIHDYLARHASFFAGEQLIEQKGEGSLVVELELLRAVHQTFAWLTDAVTIPPDKVLALARAYQRMDQPPGPEK